MKRTNWEVLLCWVKAHAGILGNELADTLAKKAATNESLTEDHKRIPKSVVKRELEEESMRKWQRNWTQTTKGSITKEYFPNVEERLKIKNKPHTKPHGNSNGTWKNKSIPTPI